MAQLSRAAHGQPTPLPTPLSCPHNGLPTELPTVSIYGSCGQPSLQNSNGQPTSFPMCSEVGSSPVFFPFGQFLRPAFPHLPLFSRLFTLNIPNTCMYFLDFCFTIMLKHNLFHSMCLVLLKGQTRNLRKRTTSAVRFSF